MDLGEMFRRRVDEQSVANFLTCIGRSANRRERPTVGDLSGSSDFWFDGGAGRQITGWTEYCLIDGTRATVDVVPALAVTIEFPNGCVVEVRQTSWEVDDTGDSGSR